MEKRTLEQILEATAKASDSGIYGLCSCKDCIKNIQKYSNKSLYQLLGEYVDRRNEDPFFNDNMVQACWQLINER